MTEPHYPVIVFRCGICGEELIEADKLCPECVASLGRIAHEPATVIEPDIGGEG